MRKKEKLTLRILAVVLALLVVSTFFTYQSATLEPTGYYDTQIAAVHKLEDCVAAVKG